MRRPCGYTTRTHAVADAPTDNECGRFQLALESLLFNVVAGWQQELRPGMQGYRFSRPTASTKHF